MLEPSVFLLMASSCEKLLALNVDKKLKPNADNDIDNGLLLFIKI